MLRRTVTLAAGRPFPLGATWDGEGINFALFSAHAERAELCLFDSSGQHEQARVDLPEHTDHVWHGYLSGARPELLYGYRLHGPYEPDVGHRFNPNKLLLDPYARAFGGRYQWSDLHYGYVAGHPDADMSYDERDNAAFMCKCRVVDDSFDWEDDAPPGTPLSDSIVYEAHVKGFSIGNPKVPEALRGTYAGLCHPASIDHFQRLGVTAVELLPVHAYLDEPYLLRQGLVNYWGYNSIGFFSPTARYGTGGGPGEFKQLVKQLHRVGIEVLLDVVYNHTAEGDQLGPTHCFRGIDNVSYYRLAPDHRRFYENHTGCGNTLDLSHPLVVRMVMDSLRYWVREMHVDGFRFDLATALARNAHGVYDPRAPLLTAIAQDPVLQRTKLIAEPWDVGLGGYQVGRFPAGWSEWNDKFRDVSRLFWLHRGVSAGEMARRLAASSDLFQHDGRRPQATVNLITAHDGFTLRDTVSYAHKHNEANGQHNRDGSSHNLSHNCGVEGETKRPAINALRRKLSRNLLATLMLSQGIPMLLAGDEFGQTQGGNNNAYCQDNETAWLNWARADVDLLEFTQRLVALRKAHPNLKRARWLRGQPVTGGERDVLWISRYGTEKTTAQWEDPRNHCFGFLLGPTAEEPSLLVLLNAEEDKVTFRLPPAKWALLLDTAIDGAGPREPSAVGRLYTVAARSLALLTRADD